MATGILEDKTSESFDELVVSGYQQAHRMPRAKHPG